MLPPMAISSAVATMTAQNYGAGLIQRMNKCLLSGIGFALIFGLSVCLYSQFLPETLTAFNGSRISTGIQHRLCCGQFRFLYQFLFQWTGEFTIPYDSQSDSDLPVSYSVILLVQPDRQFFTVYHGLRSTHFHSSFLIYMYLVSEIYTKKKLLKHNFPTFRYCFPYSRTVTLAKNKSSLWTLEENVRNSKKREFIKV